MARITKHPLVRREELLDVAFELCRSHGFEAMSVEQVTQTAGVAKGTFYHYFDSKADLQEQLVGRFGESLFNHLTEAIDGVAGDGAHRLGRLMTASAAYKSGQADLGYAAFLYRAENFALRHRLFDAWRERARAVLEPVIATGVADGSFHVADAGADLDAYGVALEFARNAHDIPVHGSGEQQRLVLAGDSVEYGADIRQKAEIQHFIRFVEHDGAHFV